MKKSLNITATLEHPDFLEDLVEKLAWRRGETGYSNSTVPESLKAFETSSLETYVSGTVSLSDNDDQINMPFITSFLFTCIKEKDGIYDLVWSSSQS